MACPNLTGAIPRITFGANIARTGGRIQGVQILFICLLGMYWNLGYILFVDPATVEDWSVKYFMWCLGGLMAGSGISFFPMIINVLFWS